MTCADETNSKRFSIGELIHNIHLNQPERNLEKELNELKLLFSEIKKNHTTYKPPAYLSSSMRFFAQMSELYRSEESKANPVYPKEDYESFIARMIELKKKKIEAMLAQH